VTARASGVVPGKRYRVEGTACVTRDAGADSPVIHRLPNDTVVVCAEAKGDASGDLRVRISSPAGWVDAARLTPAEPLEPLALDYETFLARHLELAPGVFYGLEFPFTLEMLQDFGPKFLTAAFRATNYLGPDNSVKEILALEAFDLKGASTNAFMTVAYEKDAPGLQTEFFVKAPRVDLDYKYFNSRGVQGEAEMVHFSQREAFPVTTAKCCFADYSPRTLNYLLITERVAFGVAPIEPASRKGYDHLVPAIEAHYRVRAKAQARLIAAFKAGRLGYDVETLFPFARAARNFEPIVDAEAKVDRLIDFIQRVAPRVFPAAATDPAFLARWREDLLFGFEHKDVVVDYLHETVDYTGLCHINLTTDNAWYWRDETGELHVGLLDWGGAGQMSIGQALAGMVMMLEPDKHLPIVKDLIRTFIDEYARVGGVRLDEAELTLHYKASLYATALSSLATFIVDVIDQTPEERFAAMESWRDPWLNESGLLPVVLWIDNMLQEWLDDLSPGDACRTIVARKAQAVLEYS
jgi:hypothetical protein